jgi:HSP20 family protein
MDYTSPTSASPSTPSSFGMPAGTQQYTAASSPTTAQAHEDSWSPEEVPQLTVDVYRSNNVIFIVSTVAGVAAADLDVAVEGQNVLIKGTRRKPYPETQEMLLEECFWGEFTRELTISENFDIDRIKADLSNGILTIEIPIVIVSGNRKIPVGMK